MEKGIKIRKIRAEDVSEIVAIQESILQKKVSKKWIQKVEGHLKKQEGVGFVALKDGRVVGFIIGEIKGEGFGLEQSGWIEKGRSSFILSLPWMEGDSPRKKTGRRALFFLTGAL